MTVAAGLGARAVAGRFTAATGVWSALAALSAAAVPFVAYTGLILHHFYVKGAFLLDSGLLAFLASHADPAFLTPRAFGEGSFLTIHIVPIFLVTGVMRSLLPVSDAQFFAGFIGFCQALPGIAVFWLLRSGFGMRRPAGLAIATLLGTAFSFNGLALAIARYPHFEMLAVGSFALFAVALFLKRPVLAGAFFALCLATREDVGLHIFAVLFVYIALNRWRGVGWRDQRTEIAFALAAFAYSGAILLAQAALSTGPTPVARIYFGDPPFAHLAIDTTVARLLGYALFRAYIILPAAVAAIWAILTRNPYIIVGYVAFLPWGLLQLVAQSDIAGTLSAYYAYPFMIASFWPLLGVLLEWRRRGVEGRTAAPMLAFAAMIAVSFTAVSWQLNPGGLELPGDFFDPPSQIRQATTERAIAEISRSRPLLGTVRIEAGIVAIAPDDFLPSETIASGDSLLPDTIVYFSEGYEAERAGQLAAAARLVRRYRVPGTSLRLATDRDIPANSALGALLAPSAQ
jgi:hypothetical protein